MQLIKFTPKLRVIVLFIVLFSGISLVPTLQIAVQGQVQQQRSPPTPGTIAPPSITPAPSPPQSLGAEGGAPSETQGGAASETEGGAAANQSGLVMIPQSSVMMMINNVQIAMGAVGDDEDAMMALESVDEELRSAATAAGISIENITDGVGGDIE